MKGFNMLFGYFLKEMRTTRFKELFDMVMAADAHPRMGIFGPYPPTWDMVSGYDPATVTEMCESRPDYIVFMDDVKREGQEEHKAGVSILF